MPGEMERSSDGTFAAQFIEHEDGPSKLREVFSMLAPGPAHGLGGEFVRQRALLKSRSIAAGNYKRDEDDSDDDEQDQQTPSIKHGVKEDEEEDTHAEYPSLDEIAAQHQDGTESEDPMVAWTYHGLSSDGGVVLDFTSPKSLDDGDLASPLGRLEKMYEEMKANATSTSQDQDPSTAAASRPLPQLKIPEADMAAIEAELKTFNATLSRAIKRELKQTMRRSPMAPANTPVDVLPPRTPLQKTVSEFEDCLEVEDEVVKQIQIDFLEGQIRPLNLVLMIVGTRGDVQPFVGIALKLKEYGHRVRIATHKVFREFVTGFGLEFYPLGGDPKVLSEFVVKHRGIWPGLDISGVMEQKAQMKEIVLSVFPACTEPDPEGGENGTPGPAFTCDAIVANPAAYGAGMCAEKLEVPFHVVFTMPWNPTSAFPHPFARMASGIIDSFLTASSNAAKVANRMTYFAVEQLAWLGPADYLIKLCHNLKLKFHKKIHGPHSLHYSKVPFTYIWSPALVPRPDDWPVSCEVVGFVNLDLKQLTAYTPPKEISDFLAAGPPPIYIGFGSLVVDNPAKLTHRFLKAIKATKQRAIIQKGWGGLGAGVEPGSEPEGVLFIGPAAHDWLFPRCSAVVHHGGAGTTACGLYCGKPTFIVPFFGDQPFWGGACFRAGVGPAPVTIDQLTSKKIIEAFEDLMKPERTQRAEEIQALMLKENGAEGAVDHIHRSIYGALLGHDSDLPWLQESYAKHGFSTASVPENVYDTESQELAKLKAHAKRNPDAHAKSAPNFALGSIFSSSRASSSAQNDPKKANSIELWSHQIHPRSEISPQPSGSNPFGSAATTPTASSAAHVDLASFATASEGPSGVSLTSEKYHEAQFVIGSDRMTGKIGGLFVGSLEDFVDNSTSVAQKTVLTFKKWGGIGRKWLHFTGGQSGNKGGWAAMDSISKNVPEPAII